MVEEKRIPGISIESQELIRRLATMAIGDFVPYSELNVIAMGDTQNEKRFALNTARRHLLNAEGKVFACIPGDGIKRLNDSEKILTAGKTRAHIQRQAGKAMKVLASVEFDALSNQDKIKHNAEMSVAGVLKHCAKPRQMLRLEAAVTEAGQRLQLKETLRTFEEKQKLEVLVPREEKKA